MLVKDIRQQIESLKQKKNALILAHNYQVPEIQDIADYVGDSLELARISQGIKQDTILLCGVYFMAEITKILNPDKTVLMPDQHAGCPMANMITPALLSAAKQDHPKAAVVCYVNSNADVKALTDICCTSANGVKVAESLSEDEILFIPDQYLGAYVSKSLPRKRFHLWPGYCPTHMVFSREGLEKLKEEYPGAKIVAHPECRLDVQEIADRICSTSQMITYAKDSEAKHFIICTELGMLHRLKKENPEKVFIAGSPNAICPNMKLTTLEKILWSLERNEFEITVDEQMRIQALGSIERMLMVK
ncbi:MAG: quinolinate synthase NadA [candidate division WOR-3 bacterium]|nr:MAG: quinolinate synthase NadA [candidate division WOR-3 bacterium]